MALFDSYKERIKTMQKDPTQYNHMITLRTLLAEVEKRHIDPSSKAKLPLDASADNVIVREIQKSIDNNKECIAVFEKRQDVDNVQKLTSENAFLESILPAKVSDDVVKNEVVRMKSEGVTSMKDVMANLTAQFGHNFDKRKVKEYFL